MTDPAERLPTVPQPSGAIRRDPSAPQPTVLRQEVHESGSRLLVKESMCRLTGDVEPPAELARVEVRFLDQDLEHFVLGEGQPAPVQSPIEPGLEDVVDTHDGAHELPGHDDVRVHLSQG